jgi:hypothetical protein
MRTVLPALTKFAFDGNREYMEDLVSRIDAPRLDGLRIVLFNAQLPNSNIPELYRFVAGAERIDSLDENFLGSAGGQWFLLTT